jgi:hypothetical protein
MTTTVRRAFLDSTLLRWYVTGAGVPEEAHRQDLADALHVEPERLSFETREVEDEDLATVIDVIQSDGQPLPPPPPTVEQRRETALGDVLDALVAVREAMHTDPLVRRLCAAFEAWLKV